MDVKKLPPSLLVALGLAGCGPSVQTPTEEEGGSSMEGPMTTTACLICPPDTCDVSTGPCLAEAEVSACLEQWTSTTAPCLIPPLTETSSATGTDTDSDSGSGSGSGSDSGSGSGSGSDSGSGSGSGSDSGSSSGGADQSPRARTLRGLIESGILPPDLAGRLRGRA